MPSDENVRAERAIDLMLDANMNVVKHREVREGEIMPESHGNPLPSLMYEDVCVYLQVNAFRLCTRQERTSCFNLNGRLIDTCYSRLAVVCTE